MLVVGFGCAVWIAQQCEETKNCAGYSRAHYSAPQQQPAETLWERTLRDPLALYTFLLAIFTCGLAAASIWQGYFLIQADRTARRAADAALLNAKTAGTQATHLQNSAEQAARAAKAMEDVAREMGRSAAAAQDAANVAKESVGLAKKEFAASHRPKLRVHEIFTERFGAVFGPSTPQGFPMFRPGEPMKGELYVTNIGDTAATIIESNILVFLTEEPLPMRAPFEIATFQRPFRAQRLEPGQTIEGRFVDVKGETANVDPRSTQVYVMGQIGYQDDNSVPRRMLFCRQYDGMLRRFVAVDNADYERED